MNGEQLSIHLSGAIELIKRGCDLTSAQNEKITREIESISADPEWLHRPASVIEWDFKRYHDRNPDVYRRLEAAALSWAKTSPNRVGVKRLAENLRYSDVAISSDPVPPFKINNNHTSLYAQQTEAREITIMVCSEARVDNVRCGTKLRVLFLNLFQSP